MRKIQATILGFALAISTIAVAVPASAHTWGGYQKDECGGLAPVLTTCTSGAHFRFTGDTVFRHGFTGAIGEGYTGTATSRLTYLGGERSFTCDFVDGATVAGSCVGAGEFPPFQQYYVQLCESYNLGTTTPGGSGEWGCFVEHG